jgi:iron complex outermembrane recepter protein
MYLAERGLIALTAISAASAAHAESAHAVDVPAARVGAAVVALGRQTGISIGVSDPALAALTTRPVRGRLTVRQALQRMLRGTGASFVRIGGNGYRIVRTPSRPLRRRTPPAEQPDAPAPPEPVIPEDIIVTASKRSATVDGYPASVAILDLDDFPIGAEGGGSDAITSRLPGVTSTHFGPGRNKLFIRGLADSSFNGTTQATVGQYLGETRLNYNAPDPDLRLYDVQRIEVLQGPQGTLHGAGSLGGVLRVLPAEPESDEVEGSAAAALSLTTHGEPGYDLSGMLNLPLLSGGAGLRLVGYAVRDGGYIDDRTRGLDDVNRVDTVGGRAWLRLDPGAGWTIDLGGAFQSVEGDDSQYADRDAPDLTKSSPIAEAFDNDYRLAQFVARKEWDGLSFTSATSLVRQRFSETFDASQPGNPTQFHQTGSINFFSSENRLAQAEDENGLGWVIGTSLLRNRYRLRRTFSPVAAILRDIGGVENEVAEATLFGEASFRLNPSWSVLAGGRLTHLRLSGEALDVSDLFLARAASESARRKQTSLLPSLALAYEPGDDLTLYLRYQESFRPGGIVPRDEFVTRYSGDDVRSVEAGLRYGRPGRDSFDAAASIAYTDWDNIQADQIDGDGLPTTLNIGDGRVVTADVRMGWRPLPGLELEAAAVFADSKLTNPQPSSIIVASSDLPNVARFNGRIGADYQAWLGGDFDLRLSAWARYVGKSRLGVGPVLGEEQGDYVDTAVGARLERGRYAIVLGVTNLLDTIGNRFALGSPFTLVQEGQITPLRPRTFRLGLEVGF